MRNLRIARSAATVVLAGLLAAPAPALAAVQVTVDGGEYTEASSGDGWSWDGAYDMGLNGYNGGSIRALGDLTITLTGENIMGSDDSYRQGIVVRSSTAAEERGALTITGTGSLDVESGDIYADGDLVIDGTTVRVDSTGGEIGIYGRDNLTIRNGSVVEVDMQTYGPTSMYYPSGLTADNSTVVIDGSRVVVNIEAPDGYTSGVIAASNLQWFEDDPQPNTPQIVLTGGSQVVTPESWIVGEHRTDDWSSDQYDYYEIYMAQPDTARADGSPEPLLSVVIDYLVPESEQATVSRTVSYVFEDGSEAAPACVDTVNPMRVGERYSAESYITWQAWKEQTFPDVVSPEVSGYTPSLAVVTGESVDGDAADLFYTVVYTPKAAPVPDPAPADPELPKIADESNVVLAESVELPRIADETNVVLAESDQLPKTADKTNVALAVLMTLGGAAALAAGGIKWRSSLDG